MYIPSIPPSDAEAIPSFLWQELGFISKAMSEPVRFLQVEMSYVAPTKPRDGMVVLADGTSWNPGSGGGFYGYRAGAWRFLG